MHKTDWDFGDFWKYFCGYTASSPNSIQKIYKESFEMETFDLHITFPALLFRNPFLFRGKMSPGFIFDWQPSLWEEEEEEEIGQVANGGEREDGSIIVFFSFSPWPCRQRRLLSMEEKEEWSVWLRFSLFSSMAEILYLKSYRKERFILF